MDDINFIVVKVNGVDVSRLPKDEVIQMFLATKDSFLVEMRRQFHSTSINKNSKNVSSSIKTDATVHEHFVNMKFKELEIAPIKDDFRNQKESYLGTSSSSPSLEKIVDIQNIGFFAKEATPCDELVLTVKSSLTNSSLQTCTSSQTDNSYFVYQSANENSERFIEQEHNLFEQCLAPEIDVEEITLRKSDSNERLGLIVCYSNCNNNSNNNRVESILDENESCTEVYINGIQPDSVAGRDGRLRQGDQILQINGKYIKNKKETELLIAENNNAVTLLISRYIYPDEDDFNDPLVADLEDDEYEEDEYYDERNLGYENCFLSSNCLNVVEDLGNLFVAQALSTGNNRVLHNKLASTTASNRINSNTTNKTCSLSGSNTTNDWKKKNERDIELGTIDVQNKASNCSRPKQELSIKKINRLLKIDQNSQPLPSSMCNTTKLKPETTSIHIDYEAEHIYETIPEDSESEPFYCSPYESSNYVTAVESCSPITSDALQLQQKNRVAQWLGIRSSPLNSVQNTIECSVSKQSPPFGVGCGPSLHTCLIPRNKNGIANSTLTCITNDSSSSSGGCSGNILANNIIGSLQNEDHDNSSSAYNTGGTTPLILMQNYHYDTNVCEEDEEFLLALTRSSKTHRILTSKDKVISPKKNEIVLNKSSPVNIKDSHTTKSVQSSTDVQTTDQIDQSFKSLCTSESNQYQTMILQQYLYSKAISNKNQQPQLHCPQFTAPNLSQYHFVSSQEVRASTQPLTSIANDSKTVLVPVPNEETMVWKVKRRPDGTRYIVRRPARNRCLLQERSIHINTNRLRHNKLTTTTEEDTISEVKTGRYWSKEDRKKRCERTRERRQHQQHHDENVTGSTGLATLCVNNRISFKTQLQKRGRPIHHQDNLQSHKLPQQEQSQRIRISQLNIGTPIEQCYQLQFNSIKNHQQPSNAIFANNTLPSNSVNISFPRCKNINTCEVSSLSDLDLHCSPIDSKTIQLQSAISDGDKIIISNEINTNFSNNCENMLHDPLVAVIGSADASTICSHTSEVSSTNAENKIPNVLSVTMI